MIKITGVKVELFVEGPRGGTQRLTRIVTGLDLLEGKAEAENWVRGQVEDLISTEKSLQTDIVPHGCPPDWDTMETSIPRRWLKHKVVRDATR